MSKTVEDMTEGFYKWDEDITPGTWKHNLTEITKVLNQLPEKQMVDLIELKGFRETVDPFSIRIFLESTEEIFENQERMKNLEVISRCFETFMRLQLMADVNY